jgi:acetyl esterase/lipase
MRVLRSLTNDRAAAGPIHRRMTFATIYFALSLVLLVATAAALRPGMFGRHLDTPFSFVGMVLVLGIVPFFAMGIVVTVLARAWGALETPLGLTGLAIHVACWTALLRYVSKVHRAFPVLDGSPVRDEDQPFCDGLTDDERQQLPRGSITWRPTFTYHVPEMLAVSVARDVIYREIGRVKLRVDIYRPRTANGPHPSVLYVHGGGWITGTRRQSRFMMYELAAAGSVVFAVSYRLAPRYPMPAAIEDVKAAVVWVREHAAQYGADPEHVVVMGGSAGGHLAALAALTPNEPRFQPGFESADTRVQGAVVLYGVHDLESAFRDDGSTAMAFLLERLVFRARYRSDPDRFRLAAPIHHVRADAPPMLFVHGLVDRVVPIAHSRAILARLREVGAQHAHLLEVPLGQHAFEVFPTPLHQRAVRVIVRFLEAVRRSRGAKLDDVRAGGIELNEP